MFGVRFGDKHTYDDFGLIFNTKTISEPKPQVKLVKVPGRNGSVDLTEVLTGDVRYDDRTIKIEFTIMEGAAAWERKRAELANYFHGEKFRIIFDDDVSYYWLGRVEVSDLKPTKSTASISLVCTVDPYKYNVTIDDSEWLWDPFDFENDIINNIGINVSGSFSFVFDYAGRIQNPIITADNDSFTYRYDGGPVMALPVGTNVIYDIMLSEGNHTIDFYGNGEIKVDYVGGSL